jgi:sugar diacid utilization regulator
VSEHEVQLLVEELSEQLGRSVLVDDASLRLVAYSPVLGVEDEVRRTAILTRETPKTVRDLHFAQGIATADGPLRTAAEEQLGLQSRVCVPIRCQGALFGYLWLIDPDESLGDGDVRLAERCGRELGAAMYRLQELEKPRRELEQRLLQDVLDAAPEARAHAAHELMARDLVAARTAIAALVVKPFREVGDELDTAQRGSLGLALDQFCRALPLRHALSLVRADHGVVLVATDADIRRGGGVAALAQRLQESLARTYDPDGEWTIAVGLGEERERLDEAHCSYAHARMAARVASRVPEHAPVAEWPQLGAYRALIHVPEDARAEELLPPGLTRLLALPGDDSLVATLEVYLDHACDAKLSAEALFLHRASLYYRLQRIEQIAGVNLKSGADRLALHVGLKLARLLGVRPGP